MKTIETKIAEIIKEGDSIVFTTDILQSATEDTPLFLLAKRGEKGTVIRKSTWREREYLVQPDKHNPFYASESEFSKPQN